MTSNQTPRSKPVGPPNVYANGPKMGQPVVRPTAHHPEQQDQAPEGGPALDDAQLDALFCQQFGIASLAVNLPAINLVCEWFKRGYRAALAAQPQARVPLTDHQIVRIYERPELAGTRHESGTAKAIAVARAIEAAHGIPAPQTKEPTNEL